MLKISELAQVFWSFLNKPFSTYWRIPVYLALGLAVAALVVALWLDHIKQDQPPPVNLWVKAKPAPEVAKAQKVDTVIKTGTIKTYGAAVKGNLKLPPIIKDDPKEQVVEATQVNGDDHPQTITTLVNSDTGQTETIVRRDPLPWLAWDTRGGVGMYAGIKNGSPAVRLEAHQELFSVKAIHFGVIGSVDQMANGPINADYFVGIGGEYRW